MRPPAATADSGAQMQEDPAQRPAGAAPIPWLLLLLALLLATLAVYQPAWRGGLVWDDDAHVTVRALRSWAGLGRIWLDVRATLQYYPLLHSAFWLEHRLWGDATLGYHLAVTPRPTPSRRAC